MHSQPKQVHITVRSGVGKIDIELPFQQSPYIFFSFHHCLDLSPAMGNRKCIATQRLSSMLSGHGHQAVPRKLRLTARLMILAHLLELTQLAGRIGENIERLSRIILHPRYQHIVEIMRAHAIHATGIMLVYLEIQLQWLHRKISKANIHQVENMMNMYQDAHMIVLGPEFTLLIIVGSRQTP